MCSWSGDVKMVAVKGTLDEELSSWDRLLKVGKYVGDRTLNSLGGFGDEHWERGVYYLIVSC